MLDVIDVSPSGPFLSGIYPTTQAGDTEAWRGKGTHPEAQTQLLGGPQEPRSPSASATWWARDWGHPATSQTKKHVKIKTADRQKRSPPTPAVLAPRMFFLPFQGAFA